MTRKLLAIAAAALAVAAAGCGGDESSSASPVDEWADGFCTAVTTWKDELNAATDRLSASISRAALEDAATDADRATEELADTLRELGAPETESGEAVKDTVDELTSTVESEVAAIKAAAEGASGLTGLGGAAVSITTSLSVMAKALSSTLEALDRADVGGELRTALEDSPACTDLSG